jgi:DNA-binding CsgD family transcriptional regulator
MPRPRALTPQQMAHAAELYREGKSRRQVAAILKVSETGVLTALRQLGVQLRDQRKASAESNRSRAGHYRRRQLVSSVFHLGAAA